MLVPNVMPKIWTACSESFQTKSSRSFFNLLFSPVKSVRQDWHVQYCCSLQITCEKWLAIVSTIMCCIGLCFPCTCAATAITWSPSYIVCSKTMITSYHVKFSFRWNTHHLSKSTQRSIERGSTWVTTESSTKPNLNYITCMRRWPNTRDPTQWKFLRSSARWWWSRSSSWAAQQRAVKCQEHLSFGVVCQEWLKQYWSFKIVSLKVLSKLLVARFDIVGVSVRAVEGSTQPHSNGVISSSIYFYPQRHFDLNPEIKVWVQDKTPIGMGSLA